MGSDNFSHFMFFAYLERARFRLEREILEMRRNVRWVGEGVIIFDWSRLPSGGLSGNTNEDWNDMGVYDGASSWPGDDDDPIGFISYA